MRTYTYLIVACCITSISFFSCSKNKPQAGTQVLITEGFSNQVVDAYWLYLPKNYDPEKQWPMIMFLQGGAASAGPNPKTVKDGGPVRYMLGQGNLPETQQILPDSFVIVNPHMRTGRMEQRQWFRNSKALTQIIDQTIKLHNADPSRIYLTGQSRGGHGTWGVAKNQPEKFAAILPIAGAITCKSGCEEIAALPMWIVHTTGDLVVEYTYPTEAVKYLENELDMPFLKRTDVLIDENNIVTSHIFSSLSKEDHSGWTETYTSPMTYQWLLNKKK